MFELHFCYSSRTSVVRSHEEGADGTMRRGQMASGGRAKTTSAKVAKKASAVLRDGRSSNRNKSVATSALAQAKGKRK